MEGHASRDQIIIRYKASRLLAGLKPVERKRHDDGEMEHNRHTVTLLMRMKTQRQK